MERSIVALSLALGIGLAIGLERERSQTSPEEEAPAGLRTYAIASLAGAIGALLPASFVLPAILAATAGLAAIAYHHTADKDAGLTSEFALLITVLLGALTLTRAEVATGVATVVVLLLYCKAFLHRVVCSVLHQQELDDALILAVSALIVWPLLPDWYMGPMNAWNPHTLWLVVLLVMGTEGAGHILARLFGQRFGLPVTGLLGGFVSSVATIGAMAALARKEPGSTRAAVAAALLSSVATFFQMILLLAATSVAALERLLLPLVAGLGTIALYAGVWTWSSISEPSATSGAVTPGRAFDWRVALGFALLVAGLQWLNAATQAWLGGTGLLAVAVGGGFIDTHAAAASIGALVASGKVQAAAAVVPVLGALSANTLSKIVAAAVGGGARFALRVGGGLLLALGTAWAVAWLGLAPA